MSLSFVELCNVISSLEDLKSECDDIEVEECIELVIEYTRKKANMPNTDFGPEQQDFGFNPIPRGW